MTYTNRGNLMKDYSNAEKLVLDVVIDNLIAELSDFYVNIEFIKLMFGKVFIVTNDIDHYYDVYYCNEDSNEWCKLFSSPDLEYLVSEIENGEQSEKGLFCYMYMNHQEYFE